MAENFLIKRCPQICLYFPKTKTKNFKIINYQNTSLHFSFLNIVDFSLY